MYEPASPYTLANLLADLRLNEWADKGAVFTYDPDRNARVELIRAFPEKPWLENESARPSEASLLPRT